MREVSIIPSTFDELALATPDLETITPTLNCLHCAFHVSCNPPPCLPYHPHYWWTFPSMSRCTYNHLVWSCRISHWSRIGDNFYRLVLPDGVLLENLWNMSTAKLITKTLVSTSTTSTSTSTMRSLPQPCPSCHPRSQSRLPRRSQRGSPPTISPFQLLTNNLLDN